MENQLTPRQTQILEYVRKHGHVATVTEDNGDAENGPSPSSYSYLRVGSMVLVEHEGYMHLYVQNRRIWRKATDFARNEPEASGAVVVVLDTFPEHPF